MGQAGSGTGGRGMVLISQARLWVIALMVIPIATCI